MCITCNKKITVNSVLQFDPTRTLSTRKRFVSEMNRRFSELKGAINDFIINKNGLLVTPTEDFFLINTTSAEWRSMYDAAKIPQFMTWLEEQNEKFILSKGTSGIEVIGEAPPFFPGQSSGIEGTIGETSEQISSNWTDVHIRSAYQKGVTRAQSELNKAGANVPLFQQTTEGLGGVFNAPFHADRARLAFTQTFEGLKGITKAMDAGISSALSTGMAEGRSPRQIAKSINDRVDKIGLVRAKTLARTEVVRAHHQASINEYERAGIQGVTVKAEWSTAGFNVCQICQGNEGRIFTLDAIRGLIPAHPNCRCVALPIVPQTRIDRIRKRRGTTDKQVEKNTWKNGTTHVEVRDNFEKLGINDISYNADSPKTAFSKQKNKLNAIGSDLSRFKLENKKLSKLMDEMPTASLDMANRKSVGQNNNLKGLYSPFNTEIQLASQGANRRDSLNFGKWTVNSDKDIKGTFRHEYGHHVYSKGLDPEQKKAWREFYKSKDVSWWKRNVSHYSATNHGEALAESFAAYTSPLRSEDGKNLPVDILNILNGWFK